jgi:hypothetical protein
MQIVFRTLIFHFTCIIIFTILYSIFSDDYNEKNDGSAATKTTFIDVVLFSTTIQAGVGISNMYPLNATGKLIMILQQIIMMCTNLFALYFIVL